ncbi:MAG: hypothetical protein KGH89_07930 [Thaumarchaeota archaeon]|nr:hypothetical protein [Nitrososphaerota archaeon]MDE1866368.1 hypothetical protein [Nitrososphaerota archaeon]
MNNRPTILEIASTSYETEIELISFAMNSLQLLCDVRNGFLISEPMHRFGWAFFKILIKDELLSAMQLKVDDKIQKSKGKKYEEKFASFMANLFEQNNAKVKVKLIEG